MPLTISGGNGGAVIPPAFKITGFANDKPFNEKGVPVANVNFNWSYQNGSPVSQSISPHVGSVAAGISNFSLTQILDDDTEFTLNATDGVTPRNAVTQVLFYYPVLWGVVPNNNPTELDLLAMNKQIGQYNTFTVTLNPVNEHTCFVSPMTHPITDVKEKIFGLSIWSSYNVINNFPITMADGLTVPCKIVVKNTSEHTSGMNFDLEIVF